MKIVDDAAEQEVLESLLEASKPAAPEAAAQLDYLLATPFRCPPTAHGSRFRSVADPSVFCGAAAVRTACAEVIWRRDHELIALAMPCPVTTTSPLPACQSAGARITAGRTAQDRTNPIVGAGCRTRSKRRREAAAALMATAGCTFTHHRDCWCRPGFYRLQP
ncbi:RES domain-containing protein [Accumulibacter sp.]|uniref:RES domain-containing protein n=1 Tax=Accumulibacter sp. TaxID=2053492 RepID=UPI001A4FE1C7|nr:RES domain-containing protein [Accumulibacter sp.]MBL8375058.1 RES domain-containing protein [Accumulibacter sp.]